MCYTNLMCLCANFQLKPYLEVFIDCQLSFKILMNYVFLWKYIFGVNFVIHPKAEVIWMSWGSYMCCDPGGDTWSVSIWCFYLESVKIKLMMLKYLYRMVRQKSFL